MYEFWLVGGVIAILLCWLLGSVKDNSTQDSYDFGVYLIFYILLFGFSWLSVVYLSAQKYVRYKGKSNERV